MSLGRALLLAGVAVLLTGLALVGYTKWRRATVRVTEVFTIALEAPGLPAVDVEAEVVTPLERALNGVPGLESLRSVSEKGLATIELSVTAVGVDATPPLRLVDEALKSVRRELPPGVSKPWPRQRTAIPVTQEHLLVRSSTLPALALSRWVSGELRRKLETQRGVREVRLCGALEPSAEVALDVQRLRAVGLRAEDVVESLRTRLAPELTLPGVRPVRGEQRTLEELGGLALKYGEQPVLLRDVATLALEARSGACTIEEGVLVSIDVSPDAKLELPSHPAVTVTPVKPLRTATFLAAPGTKTEDALRALRLPGAIVTAEGDTLRVLFTEEQALPRAPGLALRALDERHAVVRVSGPEFETLETLTSEVRERLERAPDARWIGAAWPSRRVDRLVVSRADARDVGQSLRLALFGEDVGALDDETRIRVSAGRTLDDALLPDGRPVTEVAQLTRESEPGAVLRVNALRTMEVELGLEAAKARQALTGLELPAGYLLTVTER